MIGLTVARFARLSAIALLCAGAIAADPAATITIHPESPGVQIPGDFSGLSFETKEVLPDSNGKYFFRADNKPLLQFFNTLGITSLRIGGNTTDTPSFAVPKAADIDSLFAFAKAANSKVIFTLRLRQGDPTAAAAVAKYVMDHYRDQLTGFSIGNEPNVYDPTYELYRTELNRYIGAVIGLNATPQAVFCAPSTTPDHAEWAQRLSADYADSGLIRLVTQHEYPGGSGRAVNDAAKARSDMLSPNWVADYAAIYNAFAPAAGAHGLAYRLEETNNYYNGGARNVSDTLASALWALDYMHWWAAHGAAGLNFHTGDQVAAGDEMTTCYYASFWTAPGGFDARPISYALTAFGLSSKGRSIPVEVQTQDSNLTAYGVAANDGSLYVTIINKSYGGNALPSKVSINSNKAYSRITVLPLCAATPDVSATTGVTLGGKTIGRDGAWNGTWTQITPEKSGSLEITVQPASALIVHLSKLGSADFGVE